MTFPSAEKLQAFFLKAMAEGGWAGLTPNKMDPPFAPGCKALDYHEGSIHLLDFYWVSGVKDRSDGMIIIYFEETPVWVMHYGGYYRKSTIIFLKDCLRGEYLAGNFSGGRGPKRKIQDHLIYTNSWEGDFRDFHGQEQVCDGKKMIGTHWYRGGLMI